MSDIHISESVFTQSFLRNLTVSTNVKATFHRHLSGTRNCDLPSSGTSDGLVTSSPAEGADESDISSSPSCTRGRGTRPQAPLTAMSPHPPAEGAD